MVTLYNVISKDGFIARKDGSENFIPDDLWQNFLDICLEYGTLIIGRKTYDTIQSYNERLRGPFEKLPIKKIVITANPSFRPKSGYIVSSSPKEALKNLSKVLVTSGPALNNSLLKDGLVDTVIFYQLPISIGEGIKPFDQENITLLPIENHQTLNGVEVCEYRVA